MDADFMVRRVCIAGDSASMVGVGGSGLEGEFGESLVEVGEWDADGFGREAVFGHAGDGVGYECGWINLRRGRELEGPRRALMILSLQVRRSSSIDSTSTSPLIF